MDEWMILNGGRPRGGFRARPALAGFLALLVLLGAWAGTRSALRSRAARRAAALEAAERAAAEERAVAEAARDPSPARLEEAVRRRAAGDWAGAREAAFEALDSALGPETRSAAERLLGEIHLALVMNPYPMPEKQEYTIERGDSLAVLARRFGTTVELLARSHRIQGSLIRPGDRLRILNGTFSVEVRLSDNTLTLRLNDRFFKRYRVGTGEFQKTPVGEFRINDRIAQPTWWRPDGREIPYGHPENVLGTHWLSLDIKGYGIHGTWEPESIGRAESAGCVRLLNEDIEELFTLLPVGVKVRILP